jgi:hypothetical protein
MKRHHALLVAGSLVAALACGSDRQPGVPDEGRALSARATAEPGATAGEPATTADGKFSTIPEDRVDPGGRASAEAFAKRYEEIRAQGSFAPLGDEATEELRAALTVHKQQEAQKQIEARYGKYQSLEYVEALRPNASPESTIYRFRATFTRGRPEIRVIHDARGRVSGFWIKPWRDSLEPQRPQKLPEDQVNTALRDASQGFAADYLEQRKAGRFEVLGNQVTDELRAALTPQLQRESHAAITAEVGDYESMTYVETYRITGEPGTMIFRFRGDFTRGRPEIRVVRDAEGKVSGFWIKPWRDRFD